MMISAYRNGKKNFTHTAAVGNKELICYFSVDMKPEDVSALTDLLNIEDEVVQFYACVIINDAKKPRTFIAYSTEDGSVVDMSNVSTGMLATEIIKSGLNGGN